MEDAAVGSIVPAAVGISQQHQQQNQRRQSASSNGEYMSEEEQDDRRKQIQQIMKDPTMSQADKSRAIQQLMDGRRRSSMTNNSVQSNSVSGHNTNTWCSSTNYASTMARAAAQAHDYYSSDEEGDAIMEMDDDYDGGSAAMPPPAAVMGEDITYGYGYDRGAGGIGGDERSVASSVTHTSYQSNADFPPPNSPAIRPGTYRQVHGRSYSLQDWNDVDRAAAAANSMTFIDNPAQISRLMETSRPQCEHYDRNCTIVAPCCGLAFGCRICHDECPALPKPLAAQQVQFQRQRQQHNKISFVDSIDDTKSNSAAINKMNRRRSMPLDFDDEEQENHHEIDRFAIREVICRSCYTRQSSKT